MKQLLTISWSVCSKTVFPETFSSVEQCSPTDNVVKGATPEAFTLDIFVFCFSAVVPLVRPSTYESFRWLPAVTLRYFLSCVVTGILMDAEVFINLIFVSVTAKWRLKFYCFGTATLEAGSLEVTKKVLLISHPLDRTSWYIYVKTN